MLTGTLEMQVMTDPTGPGQTSPEEASPEASMAAAEAFLAIALAAVSWDGVLSPAGRGGLRLLGGTEHLVDLVGRDASLILVDRAGEHGLEPLFTDPTAVPTPNEIEAPGLWLARVSDG